MSEEVIIAEQVVIEEEPKRKKGGRPKGSGKKQQPIESQGMSHDQVKDFMATLVEKMKEPTHLEQIKLDEDRTRRQRNALAAAEEARRDAEQKRLQIQHCQHRRPDEKHTFVGQVSSDGFIRGTCIRCPFEFGPIAATQHQKDNGANLHMLPDLTASQLTAWTKKTIAEHHLDTQNPAWRVAS